MRLHSKVWTVALLLVILGCGTQSAEQPPSAQSSLDGPSTAEENEDDPQIVVTPAAAQATRELFAARGGNIEDYRLQFRFVLDGGDFPSDELHIVNGPLGESDRDYPTGGITMRFHKGLLELVRGAHIDYLDGDKPGFQVKFPESRTRKLHLQVFANSYYRVENSFGDKTYNQARETFTTELTKTEVSDEDLPRPPADIFSIVEYESPVGMLPAYVTPDPKDGEKHPAIIWIGGGDYHSLGETAWVDQPRNIDQSARGFRDAGMVMMLPSLRGANKNPGHHEAYLGEVDDIVAAREYLAQLEYVDSDHIYLGGHSTGGTLVLLAACATDRFKGVLSFGAVDNVRRYGSAALPFHVRNEREVEIRSPIRWISSVQSPVLLLEGQENGNFQALDRIARTVNKLRESGQKPRLLAVYVPHANHFSLLAPATEILAKNITDAYRTKTDTRFDLQAISNVFDPEFRAGESGRAISK